MVWDFALGTGDQGVGDEGCGFGLGGYEKLIPDKKSAAVRREGVWGLGFRSLGVGFRAANARALI